ncbi:MAG: hypothetical protein L6408_00930 [Nanoarchaeota archaeon]|nr:hypothetical protein [Nanoarchaeota archaeon]
MAKKFMTMRMWILLIAIVLSLMAINPNPWASGIQIKSVGQGSLEAEQGIKSGEILKSINGQAIETLQDFAKIIKSFEKEPIEIKLETDEGDFKYTTLNNIGFETYENLTVISTEDFAVLDKGVKILSINGEKVNDTLSLKEQVNKILPLEKMEISTDQGNYIYLSRGAPQITAITAQTSNIQKGLDLQGGTRVLIRPISEEEITDKDISDLIKVLSNRLNIYGLADIQIRSAKDWEGNKFVLIEIAGVTSAEVRDLIGKQGKFEAKIGEDIVFEGGKKDIPFVCRDDGSCSGIRQCSQTSQDQWYCKFEFVIHLSPEAAKLHAEVTDKLDVISSTDGREILSETIDFYLDGKKVDSLQIGSDLKGKESTAIAISGPGVGPSKVVAIERAIANMDNLQTILITGSLPLEIEIEKLDTISPIMGKSFIKNAFLVGLLAMLSVALVVFIRYRTFKIIIPMLITMGSEILIILGFASFIGWNLDLAAIAGIIAAVGTGVDHQIIITDEVLKGSEKYLNWKQKIKRAFFIILTAYFTTVAAMIPLWNAGAGLIRGFAITTIVGVTIGVLITRPAFASITEKLLNK